MLANKIKKFLCRTASIYENGTLKVPAFAVAFWAFFGAVIIGFAGWGVYSLITGSLGRKPEIL